MVAPNYISRIVICLLAAMALSHVVSSAEAGESDGGQISSSESTAATKNDVTTLFYFCACRYSDNTTRCSELKEEKDPNREFWETACNRFLRDVKATNCRLRGAFKKEETQGYFNKLCSPGGSGTD